MVSNIEQDVKKFNPIFLVEKYFNFIEKSENTVAIPFSIVAKNLKYDCGNMYQQTIDKQQFFYCGAEEFVDYGVITNAQLLTCEGCPHFK